LKAEKAEKQIQADLIKANADSKAEIEINLEKARKAKAETDVSPNFESDSNSR
jgi:hypothetical protein